MIEYVNEEDLAPIVVTVFNRSEHTKKMVNSLLNNNLADRSEIYFFCDNYKKASQKIEIEKTIRFLNQVVGFKDKKIIIREKNYGMVKNTLCAVDYICSHHDKFIFLEDDAELSSHFLIFMNACLNYYKDKKKVMGITGWKYPCGALQDNNKVVFTRLGESWTWATWKDRWEKYNREDSIMTKFTKNMKYEFNFHNTNLFWNQLVGNKSKRMHTWSIYWYAAFFLNQGLCAAPPESLVINTGNDGTGTHTKKNNIFHTKITNKTSFNFNDNIEEDNEYFEKLKIFFSSHKPSLMKRITFRIKNNMLKILKI